ncbi:MAG: hypothetical protein GXP42_05605 [Chloroflexi bacterium]|nr:hypothetical protein [Chloroflexota bacterium]
MATDKSGAFAEFVRIVLDAIEAAGITYLIGGALAVAVWGDPRTTRDLDLVIDLPLEVVADLSRELEKREMLVPVEVIVDLVIEQRGDLPINAIHMPTGYKAELFILRPGDEFRRIALSRRRLVHAGPILGKVYVHSPEDLILMKLRYFELSRQSKHLRDIAGILAAMKSELDYKYIEEWVERFNLRDLWSEVLSKTRN